MELFIYGTALNTFRNNLQRLTYIWFYHGAGARYRHCYCGVL